MKKKEDGITKRTLNVMPELTGEQKAEIEALMSMGDESIDYSDAPVMPDGTVWHRVDLPTPENKTQITLRIDADVVDFFKEKGRRYQTKINAVLKAYVDAHKA